ncbi:hypothetical protein CEXT_38471, partial [Caerostris extrusa]
SEPSISNSRPQKNSTKEIPHQRNLAEPLVRPVAFAQNQKRITKGFPYSLCILSSTSYIWEENKAINPSSAESEKDSALCK